MLIITARTWAMIDAVGDNFFVIHDCGDIGENGYGQELRMVTMMMVVVINYLLPSDVELERLAAVP